MHRPTDRPCLYHSHDIDTLHVPTLQRHATPCHVNSAVRYSGDSYKTKNADDGKAKSRDTRTTNCETGTRERPANLFILALPCRCRHPWLSRTSVFLAGHFTQTLFHTFLHKHTDTCTDKTCAHVMHTGVHKHHLSLSMLRHATTAQARPQ